MNGLLLVNKPAGISSFDCIRKLRRTTGVKKIGHAGTLDPAATGLMLILFGTACKQASTFSKLDKTYTAQIELGKNSTTGDREGELIDVNNRAPEKEEIRRTLELFKGEITQTPSKYSAIKIDGQEAYKRARRGEDVVMPSRQVTINSIGLISYTYPYLEISADVSSGTYIRSLAEDIGKELGTGAYLSALERTSVGEYGLKDAVELDSEPDVIAKSLIMLNFV
jgi:tRNA pseudouridine55 synthase